MAAAATVAAVAGSGERGFADGPAAVAQFNMAHDVAVAPDGSYFVADAHNFLVRRVAPDGTVTTVAGAVKPGGAHSPGGFSEPVGIAVDRQGSVYVTDSHGGRIRRIVRDGGGWAVSTIPAGLRRPWGIAVDPVGHLVVADWDRNQIVRVDPASGSFAVIAGDGTSGFRDGPGATARFQGPTGVAVDGRGDIFVADYKSHRVRRISALGGIVSTVAGRGVQGHSDGVGSAALFSFPNTVAVDGQGVLLVCDGGWREFRLRRVAASADRAVATVAVDGVPTSKITGSAIDHDGSLLLAVRDRHRILRVPGLGLVPPSTPPWSLRAHRELATAAPVAAFVTTVMLCAMRLAVARDGADADAVPRLPVEMWLAILSMLRPDQMVPGRRAPTAGPPWRRWRWKWSLPW